MLAYEGLFDVGHESLIFGSLGEDLLDFFVLYSYVVGYHAEPAVRWRCLSAQTTETNHLQSKRNATLSLSIYISIYIYIYVYKKRKTNA